MKWALTFALVICAASSATLADDAVDLGQQLSNPVADLVSLPFQLNFDDNIGAGNGNRLTFNIQPVIPISLSSDWNMISRTIVPVISQDEVIAGTNQSGIGDIVQSFFFSPARPSANGLIWGAGPVFLLPTATDNALGADTFGAGVTGVVLKQTGRWTYGALANHIWDISGPAQINTTFLQPFLAYAGNNNWTYTINSESTYDWSTDEASVPINFVVSKLIRIGDRPVSIGAGIRRYIDTAPGGPSGWGGRLVVTYLFPK
ncbi:transporter [Shimia sp. SDUM112013]|uniref:transporter n=1 Tax=Shimia sp. SDUM112013 TaxID=3136160 RepID=UPI0032EFC8F1